MDRTASPPILWYHCLLYVAYVLNRTSDPALDHRQPHLLATGDVADISPLLQFSWYEPVYFHIHTTHFPSDSTEALGYWIGVAEHVGHRMTYKIWNRSTNRVVHRSAVRSAVDPTLHNRRADVPDITPYNLWLQQTRSSPSSPTPLSLPAHYGELNSEHTPYVFSSGDDVNDMLSHEYGEKEYLHDNASDTPKTEKDKKSSLPLDVVYRTFEGHTARDSRGQPILIKGTVSYTHLTLPTILLV